MTSALILKKESLNKYNSWRVGGFADVLFIPRNLEDLNGEYLKAAAVGVSNLSLLPAIFCAAALTLSANSFLVIITIE